MTPREQAKAAVLNHAQNLDQFPGPVGRQWLLEWSVRYLGSAMFAFGADGYAEAHAGLLEGLREAGAIR